MMVNVPAYQCLSMLPAHGEVHTLKTFHALLKGPVVSSAFQCFELKHTLQSVRSIAMSSRHVHSHVYSKSSMQKCKSKYKSESDGLVLSHLSICSGPATALQSLQAA